MRTNHLYDADSIAALCNVQNRLIMAAREQIIHEARHTSRHRARIATIGTLLVRFGQWLQTMAHPPIYQEETV
jgi:hypothetical protein